MIEAWVEINSQTHYAGRLHTSQRRGRLSSVFEYETTYLASQHAYAFEPALTLSEGAWPSELEIPRSFSDAAPDRWGRNLIARRFRELRQEHPSQHTRLTEADYLLGVSDISRQGALRFRESGDEAFQNTSAEVPKLIELPKLLRAADSVVRSDDQEYAAVKYLLDAGTASLGGARPKASIMLDDQLALAKFPHHQDPWNIIAWEKTALDLAEAAGISTPQNELIDVAGQDVLLLHRFDRNGSDRVGYISALTLLGGQDGEAHDYFELAEEIAVHSGQASEDLSQMWRRVAFSLAINNTDDHLRNHGFLRLNRGWSLSPVFDLNPNPSNHTLRQTTIGGSTQLDQEIEMLLSNSELFGLSHESAQSVLQDVLDAVRRWQDQAINNGISQDELVRFMPMFEERINVLNLAAH